MRASELTRCKSFFRTVVLLFTLGGGLIRVHASEADSVKSVLVLLMGQPGLPLATHFLTGFRTTLLAGSGLTIDVSTEHIDLSPLSTIEKQRPLVAFLSEKYRDRHFDVVVAWGEDPFRFLLDHRQALWPTSDAIACLMEDPDPGLTLPRDLRCIVTDLDYKGTVALLRRLHPETRHIALIGGFAAEDLRNLERARTAIREELPGVEIIDPTGVTPQESVGALARLPDHSVVLITTMRADALGRPVIGGDWLPMATRVSRSPMYCVFRQLVGLGVVGGWTTDIEAAGSAAAQRALRMLHGGVQTDPPVEHSSVRTLTFDWRQLDRWGIDEDLLPAESEVLFRPTSVWEEYRRYIVVALVLLITFALSTAALAIERKDRKQAQEKLANRLELEAGRLRLETIVSNLSLSLTKAPAEKLPEEIASGLRQIADFLGFERGTYFEIPPEGRVLQVVSSAAKPGMLAFASGEKILLPWAAERLRQGEVVVFDAQKNPFPEGAKEEQDFLRRTGIRSSLMIPLEESNRSLGVLSFGSLHENVAWPSEVITRLTIVGRVFSSVIAERRSDLQLRKALDELTALKQKLETENLYLREAAGAKGQLEEIAAKSEAMKTVLSAVERVAPTGATVLIMGETGTGKELLANAIHRLSTRRDRPMVKLNCAALPPSLIETELFGREKGAYTGALTRQAGRFELAHESTIFLDEVGDLSPDLQVKLLRVLEEGELQRVGGTQTITVDVRVIAATNRDLPAAVREGRFREDLFYRLNVFPIIVPPLRHRPDDIPLLAWAFAKELGKTLGRPVERIPQETMDSLQRYPWPGNARELRNVIERALILGDSSTLKIALTPPAPKARTADETIGEAERTLILEALEKSRWRIRGAGGAAELLGLKPSTLEHRMKKHGLRRKR